MYIYEATITKEDGYYYAEFADIGAAYADGATFEEAVKAAAETLKLVLAEHLDTGLQLPRPTFQLSSDVAMRVAIAVDVTQEFIEQSKCVPASEAARMLGLSKGRISNMINSGVLQAVPYGNDRLVTLASINDRLKNPRGAGRPRKEASPELTTA
ncbi:MAG: type II toxin-antitoxin system HicB family antitoxin [Coriobacteriia bacterium]|nr:type II toxin-antitoxin system HicB family antitoxin [Coriobacteriia bacterium]MCL2749515.1 type II toxin-antitoxin system HicB family antitoxin [Coriobacteriia bacterium]